MKKKGENKKIKFVVFLVPFFIIVGLFLIYFNLPKKEIDKPNMAILFSYTANKKDHYFVHLKPNPFYKEEVLSEGLEYASSAIDKVVVNFDYNIKSSSKANFNYTYDIKAELTAKPKNIEGSSDIWKRDFALQNQRTDQSLNVDSYSLNEEAEIDYSYYADLVRNYELDYGLAINAVLKVKFNIATTVTFDNQSEIYNDVIELDIPINNTVTKFSKNYEANKIKYIYEQPKNIVNDDKTPNYFLLSIGISLVVLSIAFLIYYYSNTTINYKQKYHKNINYVLKEYAELIVTVTNKPNLGKLKKMHLNILDDLIDVAEQQHQNIIHWEKEKDKESDLYVITNDYVYIFTVTSKELREK